jgi:hypothetical protein
MICPPPLDQLLDRNRLVGFDGVGIFLGHLATPSNNGSLKGTEDTWTLPSRKPSGAPADATAPRACGKRRELRNVSLSDAQHLNWDDRDRLISKNTFVGFDLARDVSVLNHFR